MAELYGMGTVEINMTELTDKAKLDGYVVVTGCKRCGKCDSVCPTGALKKRDGYVYINYELCDVCLKCVEVCPNKALSYLE